MFQLASFLGNPNVGVMARATERHAFVASQLSKREREEVAKAMEVPLVPVSIGGTTLVGSLLAANSKGIIVADMVTVIERKILEATGLEVFVLEDRLNAAGNNLLVNDSGCLCNPDYPDHVVKEIERVLAVPVARGTLAGLGTVGMAGVATTAGVLVHPKATAAEREVARRTLGRDVMVGTINQGTALIGAGLVANSRGAVIGNLSTGLEMGRIEEALGFLD